MTPTTKLRWIEREYGVGVANIEVTEPKLVIARKVRILQQWHAAEEYWPAAKGLEHRWVGEWRDVPLEEE